MNSDDTTRTSRDGFELHSAAYFGESRNYWWNPDYLELLGRRWNLKSALKVLDVGCGPGHWGRTISDLVACDARIVGVDREPAWVAASTRTAAELGLSDGFEYVVGTVEALPFPDDSFDLVTCQTVLIHVADPASPYFSKTPATRTPRFAQRTTQQYQGSATFLSTCSGTNPAPRATPDSEQEIS